MTFSLHTSNSRTKLDSQFLLIVVVLFRTVDRRKRKKMRVYLVDVSFLPVYIEIKLKFYTIYYTAQMV